MHTFWGECPQGPDSQLSENGELSKGCGANYSNKNIELRFSIIETQLLATVFCQESSSETSIFACFKYIPSLNYDDSVSGLVSFAGDTLYDNEK